MYKYDINTSDLAIIGLFLEDNGVFVGDIKSRKKLLNSLEKFLKLSIKTGNKSRLLSYVNGINKSNIFY